MRYKLTPIEEPEPSAPDQIVNYVVRREDIDAHLGDESDAAAGLKWLDEQEQVRTLQLDHAALFAKLTAKHEEFTASHERLLALGAELEALQDVVQNNIVESRSVLNTAKQTLAESEWVAWKPKQRGRKDFLSSLLAKVQPLYARPSRSISVNLEYDPDWSEYQR